MSATTRLGTGHADANGAGPTDTATSVSVSTGGARQWSSMPTAPAVPRLRRRRRPALLGLGVAMVAVGALLAVWLATGGDATVPVLGVARPVTRGEVVTAADLRVVRAAPDPGLSPIPAQQREAVLGRFAATDLVPGALLTSAQVTEATAPAPGFDLVGVAVKATQMPVQALRPGDRLLVVSTPPVDGDLGTDPPTVLAVTVVRVGGLDDAGVRVVDVSVTQDDAAQLAARAATGRVALVLQPRGPEGASR